MKTSYEIALLTVFLFGGCMATRYDPPPAATIPTETYSRIIDKPFDKTWGALIKYTGSTYFDIFQSDRQSGLLVLSFGAPVPSQYITGGHWKVSTDKRVVFEGDYVDYCVQSRGGYLEDRMNVIVTPIDSTRTKVTARVHYVFMCGSPESGTDSWSFESGTSDTHDSRDVINSVGQRKTKTLMPTYKAERELLDAVEQAE